MLNFTITVEGTRVSKNCYVVWMVQYGKNQIATKEATNKFASLVRLYLNQDIDSTDIIFHKNSFSYKDKIKLKVDQVHDLYDKEKEAAVAKLRATFDKKLIRPVSGIISNFRDLYGKQMTAYKFDEFLEKVGPKTVSDINSELEKLTYSGQVNIAVIGHRHQYNKINVAPAVSEPLGRTSFDSRALETFDSDGPKLGHDMGLTSALELELYGVPPEKGF